MATDFDVVVAGGGLAGSVAAAALAGDGWRVLLVERKTDPGEFNYCAEGVSARAIAPFNVVDDSLIAAPIHGGLLFGPEQSSARLLWQDAGYILHRDLLMRRLFTRAAEAGADARLATEIVDVERDTAGRLIAVRTRHEGAVERVSCRLIVCADGIAGSVGRLAGIDTQLAVSEILICAQYRLREVEVEVGFPEFWIGDDVAPGGYGWVFPRSSSEANVGLAIVADRPSARAETATKWLKRFRKKRFQGLGKIDSYITGGIPTLTRRPATAAQGVVLAGDAARSADPLSAAGIAEAMHSARHAARAASAALGGEDLGAKLLEGADRSYRSAHPRLTAMAAIRRIYDRLDDGAKAQLVRACDEAFGDRQIDQMEALTMFTQLLRASPRLIGYARYLIPLMGRN